MKHVFLIFFNEIIFSFDFADKMYQLKTHYSLIEIRLQEFKQMKFLFHVLG